MSVLRNILYLFLIQLMLGGNVYSFSKIVPSPEYQIKAAFLFNFSQFVTWPPTVFSEAQAPLIIGVLGDDPFGAYLDELVSGEKVNEHPLTVQRFRSVDEIKACHILFINVKAANQLSQMISSLKGRNILTVSDASNFMEQGGMIRFYTENNKIQLEVNPEIVKVADLNISSKLLRLAKIFIQNKK